MKNLTVKSDVHDLQRVVLKAYLRINYTYRNTLEITYDHLAKFTWIARLILCTFIKLSSRTISMGI